jgi:hypothetical protein
MKRIAHWHYYQILVSLPKSLGRQLWIRQYLLSKAMRV